MAYRHNTGYFDPKFKQNRQRREIEELLGEWYGSKFAATEISSRTEEPRKLADTLEAVLARHINDKTVLLMSLKENWSNIIAAPMNSFVKVAGLKEDSLVLEVSHPAFLMELRRKNISEEWKNKINSAVEGLEIKDIIFVPAGQSIQ